MPAAAYTTGPQNITLLANTPKVIVNANPYRVGLMLSNGTSGTVLVAFGGVDPSSSLYSWKLAAGEQIMLPLYNAIQEVRGFSSTLLNLGSAFSYTEFTLA